MSVKDTKNRRGTPPRRAGQVKVKPGVNPDDPLVRRSCTSKRGRYRNRKVALQAAAQSSRRHRQPFEAYHCGKCGRHHLTTSIARDERFNVSELVVPEGSNGRIGKLWFPEYEDELALEQFVDRAFHLVGLNTQDLPITEVV